MRGEGLLEVDTAALLGYLDAVAAGGVDGLALFDATGEFVHFGVEERMRASALAIKRSRLPVIVNASHSTLAGAVHLAEGADDAGAAAMLLSPPYFYTYGDGQILEFYRQFLQQAQPEIPIYLYNPPRFANGLSFEVAAELIEGGGFAGIQEASGDWEILERLSLLRRTVPFQLLLGDEAFYTRGRLAGADGAISGLAAAVPELIIALERSISAHDLPGAEKRQQRISELLEQTRQFPAAAGIKLAAAARGWKLSCDSVPFSREMFQRAGAFEEWFRGWWREVQSECNRADNVRT